MKKAAELIAQRDTGITDVMAQIGNSII